MENVPAAPQPPTPPSPSPSPSPSPRPARPIPAKALAAAKKLRYRPSWAKPYASGRTRALFLKIFCLATVAGFLALGIAFLLAARVIRVPLDQPDKLEPLQVLALLFVVLSWSLTLVCQPTAFVLFLVWLHRAYRNLYGLGVRSFGDSPAWAVGSFFIPLVNFYLPYRITADIWTGSRPGESPAPRGRKSFRTPETGIPAAPRRIVRAADRRFRCRTQVWPWSGAAVVSAARLCGEPIL